MDPSVLLDRFPGEEVGIIGPSGLLDPTELAVYMGSSPPAREQGASLRGWGAPILPLERDTTDRIGLQVAALALFLPILTLASAAGRAGSSARVRRHAQLRLLGYSRKELRLVTFLDVIGVTWLGIVMGSGLEAVLNKPLSTADWMPWHWWRASFSPTVSQLIATAGLISVVAVSSGMLSARPGLQNSSSPVPRGLMFSARPSYFRLVPTVVIVLVLSFLPHTPSFSYILLCFSALMAIALALAVAPIAYFLSSWLAVRASRFGSLFSARRAQRTSTFSARSAAAIATGLFVAIIAIVVVQHFDVTTSSEERIVTASWPSDTVRSTEALHGADAETIAAIPGVRDNLVLRLLQGPTADRSAFVTVGFINCAMLDKYVGRSEFPDCDHGGAVDTAPSESLSPVSSGAVEQVATGAVPFDATVLRRGKAVSIPVHLDAKDVSRSLRLSDMFANIGVTILIGEHDVAPTILSESLAPELYFRAADGSDAVDRVRTYFAVKYGNGAVVQTLAQRLAAVRTDSVVYSRALWAAVGFSVVLATATFGLTTVEDVRSRKRLRAALIAAGIPNFALNRAMLTAAMLALVPGVVLATIAGAYVGNVLMDTSGSSIGTPYLHIAELAAIMVALACGVAAFVCSIGGRARGVSPSMIAPE